jgi:hypothetical protein
MSGGSLEGRSRTRGVFRCRSIVICQRICGLREDVGHATIRQLMRERCCCHLNATETETVRERERDGERERETETVIEREVKRKRRRRCRSCSRSPFKTCCKGCWRELIDCQRSLIGLTLKGEGEVVLDTNGKGLHRDHWRGSIRERGSIRREARGVWKIREHMADSGVVNHCDHKQLDDLVLHDRHIVPQAQDLPDHDTDPIVSATDSPHNWQCSSSGNKDKNKFSKEQ